MYKVEEDEDAGHPGEAESVWEQEQQDQGNGEGYVDLLVQKLSPIPESRGGFGARGLLFNFKVKLGLELS